MGKPPPYGANHARLYRRRGRAAAHTCECGKPAAEWSHLRDTDPADPENYVARCVSCHRSYDMTPEHREALSASIRALRSPLCPSGHERPIGAECLRCASIRHARHSLAVSQSLPEDSPTCEVCGRRFETNRGLSGHRSKVDCGNNI